MVEQRRRGLIQEQIAALREGRGVRPFFGLPAPPGLPDLEPEQGKAAQVAGDVGDTVLDVVTLPAAAIRSGKLALRGAKDRVVTSAKAGSPPPDPLDLLGDVVNSVVTDARRLLDDVEARLQRL